MGRGRLQWAEACALLRAVLLLPPLPLHPTSPWRTSRAMGRQAQCL